MNRILLGALLGIVLGLVDVAMTLSGHHPEISTLTLSQAFSSRFAIGLLAANVRLGAPGAIAGGLAGLLISLPDAFALNSYAGVLGTGVFFGAFAGWAGEKWGR